jgi:23S rRNA pseudouridine1911/1915/1917 synthase
LTDPEKVGKRLDVVLASAWPELSRSRVQALIKAGQVRLGGRPVRARQPLALDDEVVITVPEPEPAEAQPEKMELSILFEDDHLLVLDKPEGLVVHPGAGHRQGTLVNALLAHCGGLSTIGGVERPGIVHRLDKDTSGCMVIAKNDRAHQGLAKQFAEREVRKHYLAVVRGRPRSVAGRVENHLGRHPVNRQKMAVVEEKRGKTAVTDYHAGPHLEGATLVHCHLHTGRTHQIRVHMQCLGHPLLGDVIYGKQVRAAGVDRLMLHSWILGFRHPVTGKTHTWQTDIPAAFDRWCTDADWLRKRAASAACP